MRIHDMYYSDTAFGYFLLRFYDPILIIVRVEAVQSTKNIIGPPKYEIIMVPSNFFLILYCDSNIGLFSIASCKVITLNLLCFIDSISSFLFFLIALSKVIALPTIVIAIVVVLSRPQRQQQKSYPYFLLMPWQSDNYMGSNIEKKP